MPLSAAERLRRFYDQFSSDHHALILINADPDAIASAMAAKRLLWHKVAGVTISNVNIVKRPDNLAMIRLLGVKLVFVEDLDIDHYDKVVMVDSQPNHNEAFAQFHMDVIIDHHPDSNPTAPFKDIRPNYGATASMMTEYLKAAKIKPSVKLATGLYHAIKTDTDNFQRQTLPEDIRAFQFLFKYANTHLARKIEQAELRLDFLKYYKIALDSMYMRQSRVFVYLGPISHPDICVLLADFFMRVNSVTWSIVSGLYEGRLIIILRNDGIRKNAGKTAKESFGNIGSAGGHKSMARAEISQKKLNKKVDSTDPKAMVRWLVHRFEKRGTKD